MNVGGISGGCVTSKRTVSHTCSLRWTKLETLRFCEVAVGRISLTNIGRDIIVKCNQVFVNEAFTASQESCVVEMFHFPGSKVCLDALI
jgi:hypothetical protein